MILMLVLITIFHHYSWTLHLPIPFFPQNKPTHKASKLMIVNLFNNSLLKFKIARTLRCHLKSHFLPEDNRRFTSVFEKDFKKAWETRDQ